MERLASICLENVGDAQRGGVLTIGNFDGVHLGHRAILSRAIELARTPSNRLHVVAMTFDPPPDLVIRPNDPPERLTPHAVKCRLLLEAGADFVVTAVASHELLGLSHAEFIRKIIVERFAPRHVVEGHDFRFGRKREGTVETLQAGAKANGFTAHVVGSLDMPLAGTATRVSSTAIRGLLLEGRVEDAATLLGREYQLYGRVLAGEGRGRLLEFPTANIEPGEQVCPADGIYAGRAELAGRSLPAAISVGHKPTFGPTNKLYVEAFLLDASGDFYNQELALSFSRRLREQRRFASAEELKAQIAKDVKRVREICE